MGKLDPSLFNIAVTEAILGLFDLRVGVNKTVNHIDIFNEEFLEDLLTSASFNLLESSMHRPGLPEEIHITAYKPEQTVLAEFRC